MLGLMSLCFLVDTDCLDLGNPTCLWLESMSLFRLRQFVAYCREFPEPLWLERESLVTATSEVRTLFQQNVQSRCAWRSSNAVVVDEEEPLFQLLQKSGHGFGRSAGCFAWRSSNPLVVREEPLFRLLQKSGHVWPECRLFRLEKFQHSWPQCRLFSLEKFQHTGGE